MSTPSMTTLPLSGLSSPMMVFSSTDLPVPEGPSITQISPAGMVSVTSPQISCLPKLLVRYLISISTPIELPLPRVQCLARLLVVPTERRHPLRHGPVSVVHVGLPTHAYQRV